MASQRKSERTILLVPDLNVSCCDPDAIPMILQRQDYYPAPMLRPPLAPPNQRPRGKAYAVALAICLDLLFSFLCQVLELVREKPTALTTESYAGQG